MSKQLELTETKKNGVAKVEKQELTVTNKETALGELHFDVKLAKERDGLNKILSMQPKTDWIKKHPLVTVKGDDGNYSPAQYLPIERVEALMRMLFQRFRIEVKESKVIANAVAVTVRVNYLDPVTGEWDYQDGVGAMAIQVDKGAPAMDFNKTKSAAIQMALPAAKSYAIKDAMEVLGQLFGGSLNRKDQIAFASAYDNRKPITTEQLQDAINRASSGDTGILETMKKLVLMTDEQIKEIEKHFPKPE